MNTFLCFTHFPLNTLKITQWKIMKELWNLEKSRWSRTSELEGQPCSQPPGFSVYLPCTLDWVQGGLQPQNTNKRSLFPLTKGPEKGKLNRDLVGISSPSPITWHRWAVWSSGSNEVLGWPHYVSDKGLISRMYFKILKTQQQKQNKNKKTI